MTIRLYDTVTREVRDLVPLEEGKVGMYVCGLTVQSEPQVGHVRSAVNFDVVPSSATPCTDVSIQDPPGVCAFHEATSSVSPKGVDTEDDVQVLSSYAFSTGVVA